MTYGAGDWDAVGRLTLHRVKALYAAWERTPPVAVIAAAYLGYKGKDAEPKTRVKDESGLAAFLADFASAGGVIVGG